MCHLRYYSIVYINLLLQKRKRTNTGLLLDVLVGYMESAMRNHVMCWKIVLLFHFNFIAGGNPLLSFIIY